MTHGYILFTSDLIYIIGLQTTVFHEMALKYYSGMSYKKISEHIMCTKSKFCLETFVSHIYVLDYFAKLISSTGSWSKKSLKASACP